MTISDEQLEAAKIDGANTFQIAFRIKIPLLQNVIRVVLVLAITGTLKVFDLPYVLNKLSNPNGQTFILGTFMYNIAYLRINIGQAAAFAVIMVVLGVLLSGFVNYFF